MPRRFSIRVQVYAILIMLVIIVTIGGLIILRFSRQMEAILSEIVKKDLVSYELADNLETALVHQKGFVSYYYLDRDPNWLQQLGIYRQVFRERLREVSSLTVDDQQRRVLEEIETKYNEYVLLKDQVIDYYKNGENEQGVKLHKDIRHRFFEIVEACEKFRRLHKEGIKQAWERSRSQALKLALSVGITAGTVFVLVLVLIVLLTTRILDPLRLLIMEAGRGSPSAYSEDLKVLRNNVHELIRDAGQAQAELEQNREILVQSEKLALVGKLAAGTAHSIRNPLTSVKMRLFSLSRTLQLGPSEQEDFDVISEEIQHLDTIVQNFLEFSRPPKLTMQKTSISSVIDQSIQLLKHRLKSYNVTVKVFRNSPLPETACDPEQLKEVFVNLIINACESMSGGGGR